MRLGFRKPGGRLATALAAGTVLAAAVTPAAAARAAHGATRPITLRVDGGRVGRLIPPSFLGIGIEYGSLARYAGDSPRAPDPVLVQLLRNVTPGQPPVLRIGGDTTDWSWWPVPGMHAPPPVSYSITPAWTAVTRTITRRLGARLILGINLQVDSRQVADTEATRLLSGLGHDSVAWLELGNEPELYHSFGWYVDSSGNDVPSQSANWDYALFERGFTPIARSLPSVPLAGPATGNPYWDSSFARFLRHERRVKLATVHRYPLQICSKPSAPGFPSVAHLLTPRASAGLATGLRRLIRIAHAHRVLLRVDELNITPCPYQASVLRSRIATALWAADVPFELAAVGADGVNLQTTTGGTDNLFSFALLHGRWRATVQPEYYGLLMFAQAAPAGARLVPLSTGQSAPLRVWATSAPDRSFRVLVINNGPASRSVSVDGLPATGTGSLELLRSKSTPGGNIVTLGGQTFGAETDTGRLAGRLTLRPIRPRGHRYLITVPGLSAALLTAS